MRNHINLFIIILLVSISNYAYSGGPPLPEGYRFATDEELALPIRDPHENRYSFIFGDFNGDKLTDGAILAINIDSNELTIFAFLNIKNRNDFDWHKIDTLPYDSIRYTGIEKVNPGKIKHYSDINNEKKAEYLLLNDAIRLFNFEGSSSVIYFDTKINKFKRIWTSK